MSSKEREDGDQEEGPNENKDLIQALSSVQINEKKILTWLWCKQIVDIHDLSSVL